MLDPTNPERRVQFLVPYWRTYGLGITYQFITGLAPDELDGMPWEACPDGVRSTHIITITLIGSFALVFRGAVPKRKSTHQ